MMFRGFFAGVLATIIIMAACVWFALRGGVLPANADATPVPLEEWAARTSLRATLTAEAPTIPNPVALTDDNLLAGIELYGKHCVICHGTEKGDQAASPLATGLYPRPPQMATDGVEDSAEGVTFWEIRHGIRWSGMPAWKNALSDEQIWTLALFLRNMDRLPPTVQPVWRNLGN